MSKKYHSEHPTISFRCRSKEEYDKIKRMVKISGKSESDFIREIILKMEQKESKSFNSGCESAVDHILLNCSICGELMAFNINADMEIRQKILEEIGEWVHAECFKKQQQQET